MLKQMNKSFLDNYRNGLYFPLFYVIEISSLCNLKCSICPQKDMPSQQKGLMEFDVFKTIISKIKPFAKCIMLYWMGEPLLNKYICEMISYAKKNTKAKIIISTNGQLMDENNTKKIIDSGLDEIIFSVDALNSETYSHIRTNGNLAILVRNIEYFISYKKLINSKIKIRLQFIEMNINSKEKENFIKRWEKKDCSIEFSCLYSWANQMPELNNESNVLSPLIGKRRTACTDLWYKMCVRFNGDVSLCCFDYNNKICIGNLLLDNVKNIWNSELIKKIRNEHLHNNYADICDKCDSWAVLDEYSEFK